MQIMQDYHAPTKVPSTCTYLLWAYEDAKVNIGVGVGGRGERGCGGEILRFVD